MFKDLVISGDRKPTKQKWTMLLSVGMQVAVVGVLLILPLLFTEVLPKGMLTTFLAAPPPPPPPPPPAVMVVHRPVVHIDPHTAPAVIPRHVVMIHEDPTPPDAGTVTGGVVGGISGGTTGGVMSGIIGGTQPGPPPPPAPKQERVRIGGNVIAAKIKRQTLPVYPTMAKTAHVSGTVVLHAIIAKDGTVQQVSFISGPALLMSSALNAVKQWTYEPTYLNGEAVEVDTTVSVVYSLQQ